MKECYRCKQIKNEESFGKDKSKKDGLRIYCFDCAKIIQKNIYYSNPEIYRDHQRQHRKYIKENDPEKYKKLQNDKNKRYWEKLKGDPERRARRNEWVKEYRKKHPEKRQNEKKKRRLRPEKYLLEHSKKRANKKGLEHNLSLEDIIVPNICPILNIPIFVGER